MEKQIFAILADARGIPPQDQIDENVTQMKNLITELGYDYAIPGTDILTHNCVLNREDAKAWAKYMKEHPGKIDGIIIELVNFGTELEVVDAIEYSGLNVPILVQAVNDDIDKLVGRYRRDSWCGKISVCNNLYQRGIPFTRTTLHTCYVDDPTLRQDIINFAGVCRVVNGMKGARVALLGIRPDNFNTCRYSEKILQAHGISMHVEDMAEIIYLANNITDEKLIDEKVAEIKAYAPIECDMEESSVRNSARLCIAFEKTMENLECTVSAIQCRSSCQKMVGCSTCLCMSMMTEKGMPSACEGDVTGAISMLAAYLATGGNKPALLDWDNNIRNERDQCVSLHCSNFAKSFYAGDITVGVGGMMRTFLGKDQYQSYFGNITGRVQPGDMTFVRFTTDDTKGLLKAYVGEGYFGDEQFECGGGIADCHVENLQQLMGYVCDNGFEHHVCFVRGHVADIIEEALTKYMDVQVYRHR